jgi:N6-adenosine-specific RNA methylase IME4
MKAIKKILIYTSTIHSLHKETKRAWAEYYEMERRLARQKFILRLYGTLLLGFLFAMVIDKLF